MKPFRYQIAIALTLFLAACGGSSSHGKGQGGSAALSACDASEALPGDTTTCETKECAGDCSLFFKLSGTDRTFWLGSCSNEDKTEIEIPATIRGSGDIYCCAGDCEDNLKTLAKNFKIQNPTPHNEPASDGAEEVSPTTPNTQACLSDADCISGSHCQGGTCTTAPEGLPAEPVPPSAVTPDPQTADGGPLSASIQVIPHFEERIGLVEIKYAVTGGQEDRIENISVYSDGFNRLGADAAQAQPCSKIMDPQLSSTGERHLLLNPTSGPNLGGDVKDDGNEVYQQLQPYLESAQLCDGNACFGYTGPDPARPPTCVITLRKNGRFVRSGSLFTRVLDQGVTFHLVAKQASEDPVHRTSPVVEIPHVAFKEESSFSKEGAKMIVHASYENALGRTSLPHPTCTESSQYYKADGDGEFTFACPMTIGEIMIHAQGIGAGNSVSRKYSVTLQEPELEIVGEPKAADNYHCSASTPQEPNAWDRENCRGAFDKVQFRVKRDVIVRRSYGGGQFHLGSLQLADSMPLFKTTTTAGMTTLSLLTNDGLYGMDPAGNASIPEESDEALIQIPSVIRNHQHFRWKARLHYDNKQKTTDWLINWPFAGKFDLNNDASMQLWLSSFDECGGVIEGGCGICVEQKDVFLQGQVSVTVQNIKDIQFHCSHSGSGTSEGGDLIGYVSPMIDYTGYNHFGYSVQTLFLRPKVTLYNTYNWHSQTSCTITGKTYDDQKIERTVTFQAACPHAEGAQNSNGGWVLGYNAFLY